jgi:hypothetical protein
MPSRHIVPEAISRAAAPPTYPPPEGREGEGVRRLEAGGPLYEWVGNVRLNGCALLAVTS